MATRRQQTANELVRLVRGDVRTQAERDAFFKIYLTQAGCQIAARMDPGMPDELLYRLAYQALEAGYEVSA